ncbi:hypothetical protein K435DRAFT_806960 [Dendrothele bispora CBS 962.96]|uniref:Uncharacterized protein n=1 Tax=Dendrothele bispora (strain CBS 962.96) TaxID=1314807 RepID=A0A4S8L6N1_DENBC|nr:hypothetical protein K435DRAFT_806960 [Dendrothele bispora CBS 962.96]
MASDSRINVLQNAALDVNSLRSGQETAITIAKFGMGEPPVLTDTTHLIPLGTKEGGVRTTYQYDDVGEFVTTRPDGKATTISGENSGIMIASASGFVISVTNPPLFLPTDLPPFLGGNEIISCGYTAADGGECEDRVFGKEDTTTSDYTCLVFFIFMYKLLSMKARPVIVLRIIINFELVTIDKLISLGIIENSDEGFENELSLSRSIRFASRSTNLTFLRIHTNHLEDPETRSSVTLDKGTQKLVGFLKDNPVISLVINKDARI